MYLHLGENRTVDVKNVIGIFDLDTASMSKVTRKFLTDAQQSGTLEEFVGLPKSFTLTKNKTTEKIYFSQLSSKTLVGRAYDGEDNNERTRKND